MPSPNRSYDPVRVAALSPDEVQRMTDDALAAIAKAASLDDLKAARLAHAGDRSPAWARRALPSRPRSPPARTSWRPNATSAS
jgi:phenylalanyl-tRNA synthetase alpha chain